MAAATHTPGPWSAGAFQDRGLPAYTPVSANTLLAKVYSTNYGDQAQSEANARLMAAAPDLLACARDLVDHLVFNTSPPAGLVDAFRAAIRLAEIGERA